MPHHSHEASSSALETPEVVTKLLGSGFIEANPLFNVAPNPNDGRYDLIDPGSDTRLLWTPPTDEEAMAVAEELIGNEDHPVFFPLVSKNEGGNLYQLPLSVRLLATTVESSPYIPEYTDRLKRRAGEFIHKFAILDVHSFGLTEKDLIINHNGDNTDDIFFSVLPPLESVTNHGELDEAYLRQKRAEMREYIRSFQ